MLFTRLPYTTLSVAINEDGIELSIDKVEALSRQIANVIGVQKALSFCLCSNTLPCLAGYIALMQNGIVPIMLDAKKDVGLLTELCKYYRPSFIWCPVEKSSLFDKYILVFDMDGYCFLKTTEEFISDIYPDLALLLTTSGSTGSPKLVRLSYENLHSNAESIAQYLDITSEERPITSLPMYYSYGLSVINSHLIKGATLLLTDKPVIQKEFWTFAKEQKATSLAGVPYTYEMLRRLRIFKMDLPYLKTMTQAGGKLNAKIAEEYIRNAKECGKRFIVMYGQTEATARMSYLPWEHAEEKYASIGIAIPGGRFSLTDANGNEISEADVDGELVYEGANVSLGYAECIEDLAKGDENHGILHTGDVARRDADGYYYITGRLKRFVKVWGNRCNLDATEQLVKAITTNCACAGVDDKITVFVTEEGLETQIKNYLSEKMGLNSRAFAVKVIDSIPKNTSGKILYSELQKMLD